MKTWFAVGVVLVIAGLLCTLVGIRGTFSDSLVLAQGQLATPAHVAEGIQNSARWTAGGFSAFGSGVFLMIVAAVMRSLQRRR